MNDAEHAVRWVLAFVATVQKNLPPEVYEVLREATDRMLSGCPKCGASIDSNHQCYEWDCPRDRN